MSFNIFTSLFDVFQYWAIQHSLFWAKSSWSFISYDRFVYFRTCIFWISCWFHPFVSFDRFWQFQMICSFLHMSICGCKLNSINLIIVSRRNYEFLQNWKISSIAVHKKCPKLRNRYVLMLYLHFIWTKCRLKICCNNPYMLFQELFQNFLFSHIRPIFPEY